MKIQHHLGTLAIAAATTFAMTGPALAADAGSTATGEYTWAVDTSGRPPFKRERVPVEAVPEVDMAAMETTQGGATHVVWERSSSGRPPFSRSRVEVPIVDTASIELTSDSDSKTQFRGRPPFKRHR